MPNYIFDVTDLRAFIGRAATLSGIQRVVVMTIARAQKKLGPDAVWLGYLEARSGRYRVVQPHASMDLERPDHLRAVLGVRCRPKAMPGMTRYANRRVRRQVRTWLLDIAAAGNRRAPFRKLQTTPDEWRRLRNPARGLQPFRMPPRDIERLAKSGDQLLLLDNVQKQAALLPRLLELHTYGLEISVLIHDLIALVTPQFSEGEMPRRTFAWMQASTTFVERYIANSENTAKDLQRFLDARGAPQPVRVVPLAQAKVPGAAEATSEVSDADRALYPLFFSGLGVSDRIRGLAKTDFVLAVGTREVRKNLWRLALAWQALQRDDAIALPKLVIAGRSGWLNGDFDALMAATGNLGGWVEIVDAPSDRELDWLYRHCLFTAMVSYYEGWGLPIGESLAYGKTAVVSERSSMPEVGGDMVVYCDPSDTASIADACRKLIAEPSLRQDLESRIGSTPLRSWDAVASDLIAAIEVD